MFENRKKVIAWLDDVEKQYEVQDLMIKDLHLWPIIRWTLFKDIVKREGYVKNEFKPGMKKEVKALQDLNLKENFKGGLGYLRLLVKLVPKAEVLFAGSQNYRVKYANKNVNRFFDPLNQILTNRNISFINADYSRKGEEKYTFENEHFPITSIYYFLKKFNFTSKVTLNLKENLMLNTIFESFEKEFLIQFNRNGFYRKVNVIFKWAEIYERLIVATSAKVCFALCYYNEAMYGLNLACFRRGAQSVDMQHGPQGILHAAYTGFTKIPKGGYSCLPKYFWVWEEMSYNNLKERLKTTSHKVLLAGNPWISFLDSEIRKDEKIDVSKKIILFSLQPILPFLPEILLNAISKTPTGYSWWLRMHPRMTAKDKDEVKNKIKEIGMDHLVNFEEATNLPLPVVLKNSAIHISKSSGCVIEASIIGTPNIIIDPLGIVYFTDIIDNEMNFFQTEGDLWPLIDKIKENKSSSSKKAIELEPTLLSLLNS